MKKRHPAASLRVPGSQVGGMRRVTATGIAPLPAATPAPKQGGAEPRAPAQTARRHVTTAATAPARHPRAANTSGTKHATHSAASAPAVTVGQAVAALMDELAFAANQPGSYQRMGGF